MKYIDEIELEEVFNGKCIPKFIKFRESIANATIHFDESSPHLHIIGVPFKDNCKR